jgi:threonine/homoserine/homoserine lactone efflux protein
VSGLAIVGSAFVVGLSGAMMPGSMLVVTIAEVGRRGFWAGPLVVAGHALLELLMVTALLFGLSELLALPAVGGTVGILGGVVLAWMGYGIVRVVVSGEVSLQTASAQGRAASVHPGGPLRPVLGGIVSSISNPYWLLWWATIGAGYVLLSFGQGLFGVGCFFLGHISADLSWYSLVALAVTGGQRLLPDRLYRAVLAACGLFLIVFACYFVYLGWGFFAL